MGPRIPGFAARPTGRGHHGIAARSLSLLAVALGILSVAGAAPAFAAPHIYTGTSFGPDGTAGTAFADPGAVAVDPASHDVYVADYGTGSVYRFNEDHEPAEFSALGSDELGGFSFTASEANVQQLAVAPTGGDFYVVDYGTKSLKAFHEDGEPAEFFALGASEITGFTELCGVAVDSEGDIYAADFNTGVTVYSKSGETLATISTPAPCNLAVDSHGDVYVNHWQSSVEKLTPSEYPLTAGTTYTTTATVDPNVVSSVAVDTADDGLFADEGNQIAAYDSTGARVGVVPGPGEPGALAGSEGVAVQAGSDTLYASDHATGQVQVYGPAPAVAPSVDALAVADPHTTEIELQAEVNPSHFDTKAQFDYVEQTTYEEDIAHLGAGHGFDHATATPATAADLGASGLDQSLHAHLASLNPGTSYRYRIVASNENGSVEPTKTFTTPAANNFALPDDRAYEMVSPPNKNGGTIWGIDGLSTGGIVQAAPDGDAVTYVSLAAFQQPQGGPIISQYLSRREGQSGWSTQNISPATGSHTFGLVGAGGPFKAFSADLSTGLMTAGEGDPPFPGSGAPAGYKNFYRRDNATGDFDALIQTVPREVVGQTPVRLVGASSDLQHVVLATPELLTENAVRTVGDNLYEWSGGRFYPINVLPGVPDGTTSPGAGLLSVAADGSRAVWSLGTAGTFLREAIGTPAERTVPVSADAFQGASADDSKVFFRTASGDLDQFDAETELTTDLASGGEVQGVVGTSRDGSTVYFLAGADLTAGEQNDQGAQAQAGQPNLYVSHEGIGGARSTTFIGTVTPEDAVNLTNSLTIRRARVSPDGAHLLFVSNDSLTGYDNAPAHATDCASGGLSAPCSEVYLYDAAARALTCVSCNPSGARPIGPSTIPAATDFEVFRGIYESRVLAADGSRVFFDSTDGLVPQDTNRREDVYEYENNRPYLISGGSADSGSEFLDASESGNDVFFLTTQQLVPQDTDQLGDVYDARVGGGIAPPASQAPCDGDACHTVPTTPDDPTIATSVSGGALTRAPASETGPKAKKPLTRAQKLAAALRLCRRKPRRGHKRAVCEAQARKRYGTAKKSTAKQTGTRTTGSDRRASR